MNPSTSSQYSGGNYGYHHLTQRSPHTSSSKRGPAPIMAPQQTPSQAQIEAQKAAIIAADLAKRRAHKPTDKNIPDGIEEHIIGDGVQQYKRLREVERKLDAVMMRKRIDIQDSVQHGSKRHRTLRIWISNTVDNQPWQGRGLDADMFDFHTGVEATYRVKIEGRLLEDDFQDEPSDKADNDEDMDKQEDSEKPSGSTDEGSGPSKESERPSHPHSKTKLSHFFKSIIVDFDRAKNLQPDAMTSIEWKKPPLEQGTTILPATADFDCLEFERKSDENINCTINFYRDETPERYLLSKELEDVLDTEEDDRTSIILGLWEYIKALNLQQDEEKRLIQCDDRLRALFKSDTFYFPEIPTLIQSHLTPLPPLSLPYTIRVDPSFHAPGIPPPQQRTIYDVRVCTPSRIPALKAAITHNPAIATTLRQLAAADEHLAVLVQAMASSKAKHAFMTEMSRDPVGFIRRWTASQKRDLEIMLGEAGKGEDAVGEEWRRGGKEGVWGTQNVRESVGLMVQKAAR